MKKDAASLPVHMADHAALSILAAACAAHPLEACGLLLGPSDGLIDAATVARNVATQPAHRFEIDPGHLARWQRRAREQGRTLIGCWHSHPNGRLEPSAHDHAGALWPGLLWLIVAGEAMTLWQPVACGFRRLSLVRSAAAA